jgi:release factor glutamine methyltransferase
MARRPLAATSVRDALDSAVIPLTAARCSTPRLDAEVLLAAVLGVDRTALYLDPDRSLSGEQARAFRDAVGRRREREPVAYIVGSKGFRRLELQVDRRVLVPRPESEHVVEAALSLPRGVRVIDVGTGSGAIALALKDERPDLEVLATDISADALDVARANAERLGLDVTFVEGDLMAGLTADAVVANPPYVAEDATLMTDVARYEPGVAVFAPDDGLAIIARLVPEVAAAGAVFIAFEHAGYHGDDAEAILRASGFEETERIRDLSGIERVAVGRRRAASTGDLGRRRAASTGDLGRRGAASTGDLGRRGAASTGDLGRR